MPRVTFDTDLGRCGIGWDEGGLTRFELPHAVAHHEDASAVPPEILGLIERVQAHLTGDLQDFAGERYDFDRVPEFARHVYAATLAVKAGQTKTYGEIAAWFGQSPALSRAVGSALGANPWPLLIPCHRVVAASGKMTGFSGPGGINTKVKLLALEGAQLFAE